MSPDPSSLSLSTWKGHDQTTKHLIVCSHLVLLFLKTVVSDITSEFFGALIVYALLHKVKSLTYHYNFGTGAIRKSESMRYTWSMQCACIYRPMDAGGKNPVEPTKNILIHSMIQLGHYV